MAIQRSGGCVCGAIRYVCAGEPERVTICHCLWCQRRTGTAFGTEVVFLDQNVTFSGLTAASYTLEAAPLVRTVPAGTFDNPGFLNAKDIKFRHVFARSRRDWSELTSHVEVYEQHFRNADRE